MSKKICYLAHGNSIHVQRWVNYFVGQRWKVDLITYMPANKSELHQEVKQHIIAPKMPIFSDTLPRFPLYHFFRITLLLNKIKPDIIHAIEIPSWGVFAGLYSGLERSIPLIITGWGLHHTIYSTSLQKRLEHLAFKKSSVIHTDSHILKDALVSYGCKKEKIIVVPWGVNMKKFNPSINSEKIRQKLSLNDSPTIISIRQFEKIYNIECLLRAIPVVLREIPCAKFIIKGTGALEGRLRQLARDLNIHNAVRFVGQTPYEEIPYYLKSADVYVSTSLLDSSSVALQEAMACGLPVVVTDAPSNDEWVRDGWNGYIVPRKNSKKLAEKLITLLCDKDHRRLFGERNYEIAKKRVDQDKCMEKIEVLYNSLCREG